MSSVSDTIARELAVRPAQVAAAARLLDEGATVPFIARYRKEITGGLDDAQLRRLEERLGYLRDLQARRETILESIVGQGKLTPELAAEIQAADTKTRLEDLYLPYRPKRRTKAQLAREAGLEPLASTLLQDPRQGPEQAALAFLAPDKGVPDSKAALDGARQILMEVFAEDAELLGQLRDYLWHNAHLSSTVVEGKAGQGVKYADYFEYAEPIRKVPSHRALALFRGRNEGVLSLDLVLASPADGLSACELRLARRRGVEDRGRPADGWLLETVRWAWRVKVFPRLELELKNRLMEAAEKEAIRVFAGNLKDLLLAAPAGRLPIIGLDPGLRTGVKVAVVDGTGKVVETATVYPHAPHKRWDEAIAVLGRLAERHVVRLIAIGNGTASRETDRLAAELQRRHPSLGLHKLVVSEAGASVYSASELASRELPTLDVSLRGAVSIARRVQDPLAELVKIDPKSIGVGQYQHDVNQARLARTLGNVVEDCVNAVGVDVNTASPALLSHVSGLSGTLAENIVAFRDSRGAFPSRAALKEVPRLGPKAFEQAAGFLRIIDGQNPLDASGVHPEAYPVVERILRETGREIRGLIGDGSLLSSLNPAGFTDERFGLPTIVDILKELEKPGRDPRPTFRTATLRDGVEKIGDLEPGMVLEGTVTNVAGFGAFVDIGVHQDGLVHISALSEQFVRDPRQVVKAGDLVKVKVMEVDVQRGRISLSMRLNDEAGAPGRPGGRPVSGQGPKGRRNDSDRAPAREAKRESGSGALADALSRALQRK